MQGFADRSDVLPGGSFRLFVSTNAPNFRVPAFRMGWYGGDLAQLELPLVALAERLGLPLGYLSGVDLDLDPGVLGGARAVISEAHDEYWSPAMRAAVTKARDQGVNLAFFGANAIFRKIRFESSPLGPDRVEVNYKFPQEDPLYGKHNAQVTGNWPTPPDADPESSLIGQSYVCSVTSNFPMVVTDPGSWVWAGSGVRAGQALPGLVGPEFDQVNPDEPTPRPIEVLARSPVSCGAPRTYSDVSYYTASSGAGVFDAGTEDWICALPAAGCAAPGTDQPAVRRAIQAATVNILTAFALGPAGRPHPARELIPSAGGRPPLLGTT
jgi:hypothetical protein